MICAYCGCALTFVTGHILHTGEVGNRGLRVTKDCLACRDVEACNKRRRENEAKRNAGES